MMGGLNSFLELLRCSLWQRPADGRHLPESLDWGKLVSRANYQAVVGVLAEAIPFLPKELWPSETISADLHRLLVSNVKMHVRMNAMLSKVYSLLRNEGIPAVLLKGQGLASLYPNSQSRQCGDIDLYIPKAFQKQILSIAQQWEGTSDFVDAEKHLSFDFNGVSVELHYETEHFYTSKVDKPYQAWTTQQLEHGRFRKMEVNGESILLPPVEFDAIYILHHLWDHFISTGIGFRQICDWCLFMRRFASQLDEEELRLRLDAFEFYPVWNLFASFAVHYMGMDWKDFPLAKEVGRDFTTKLMEIIMAEGNFGRRKPRPKGYIVGKVNMYWRVTKMMRTIYPFYPREVVHYYFYFMTLGIKHFFLDWKHMK